MADIRSGLLTSVTDRDFKDALAGVPANVAERVKTRIAQSADVSHLNQQYYNPFLGDLYDGDPQGSKKAKCLVPLLL